MTPISVPATDLDRMLRIVEAPDLGEDGDGLPWSILHELRTLIRCSCAGRRCTSSSGGRWGCSTACRRACATRRPKWELLRLIGAGLANRQIAVTRQVRGGGAAGRLTVTRRPPSGRGARLRVPSWAWAMRCTIARPRPTPA